MKLSLSAAKEVLDILNGKVQCSLEELIQMEAGPLSTDEQNMFCGLPEAPKNIQFDMLYKINITKKVKIFFIANNPDCYPETVWIIESVKQN